MVASSGGAGPALRGQTRGRPERAHARSVQRNAGPGVVLVSGEVVVSSELARHRAPAAGPATEMLDRLWEAVGNNGLVLIGQEAPAWSYLVQQASAWKITGGPAWFTATRGQTTLRLVLMGEMSVTNDPLMGPDYLTIVSRHKRFADLVGVPFFADGGTTSALLMEQLVKPRGAAVLRAWRDERAPRLAEPSWLGPWTNNPDPVKSRIRLDKNAYFLCAACSAQLPIGGLEHTGAGADPRYHVGVWEIEIPASPDERLPHPAGGRLRAGERRWVAHPTMELLAELGLPVRVLDAWTAPRDRARRLLVPWYERLREARTAARTLDDGDARALQHAIKDTYSRGIGCLDRENRRWHRPDWRAVLYAQMRCNMYRTLFKAGRDEDRWPDEVRTDSVFYSGDQVPGAFKIGAGMGEWKVIR